MLYNKAGHPWKEIIKEEVILEIEEDFDDLTLDMDVLPEDLLDLPEDNSPIPQLFQSVTDYLNNL